MAVHVVALVRSENAVDVVGEALGGIDHLGIAGHFLFLHGHFKEVSGIIHLVLQTQIIPAFIESIHNPVRNEKAIFLLRGKNAIDDAIHPLLQGRIVEVI